MKIEAFIFDLDGVIVSTDEYHYLAWKRMADEENIPFDRETNAFLRGVSRMESLDIILKKATKAYSDEEKLELATRKNEYYKEMIREIQPSDKLPGVDAFLAGLRDKGIAMAIGSSSKNTMAILKGIGMDTYFDAVADGTQIVNSKPDPEVFLLAAKLLHKDPANCVVVEDADAGIQAALAAGMGALAVGAAKDNEKAHMRAATLADVTCDDVIRHFDAVQL